MSTTRSAVQRRAFGDFVRSYRAKVAPVAVGLPTGSRRRTPGLRREELAQLCGLSTTWFTWIEQGRDISVSPSALSRLSRVLQLGRAERAYLFDLAGKRDPDQGQDEPDVIFPAIVACVEAIDAPAYVLDRSWTRALLQQGSTAAIRGLAGHAGRAQSAPLCFLECSGADVHLPLGGAGTPSGRGISCGQRRTFR